MDGVILRYQRYSLHDGPGIRTTVFFKGCPLACRWCHNPESQRFQPELLFRSESCRGCGSCLNLCPGGSISMVDNRAVVDRSTCTGCGCCVDSCPEGIREISGVRATVDGVLKELEKDRIFYDESGGGVTFSGGEVFAQFPFLQSLLEGCRRRGLSTVIDTCGYTSWENLSALVPMVDLFLYDLKLVDSERHKTFTGVDNSIILENLKKLASVPADILVRMPVIPGVNDTEKCFSAAGDFLRAAGLRRIELLPYHNMGRLKYSHLDRAYDLNGTIPPSRRILDTAERIFSAYGIAMVFKEDK